MIFTQESEFEEAVIKSLSQQGWEKTVLKYQSQDDLLKNWASILYDNNRSIDRLNEYPLTDGEMQQILEQIQALKTPLKLNGFINGKTICITRDNPADTAHFGKEISLKIYDRQEIAAGQSRYQIVQQPQFDTRSPRLNKRRGDLMLLINGMPLFHIELKKSGVDVSQAYNQIEKYSHEGIYTGIFSLVQIFAAMTPDDTVYFANPGPEGSFNKDFYFHWADFNNEPINDWKQITTSLLSIPMAHQLIGFYTIADDSDGILKVMRSYQYYAVNKISDRVATVNWKEKHIRGGYIWHTTGSGKTMTSFKSAQLIANSKNADKVIFLIDRVELGTQSLREYNNFADATDEVQATENTAMLITKLKSTDPASTLIVTSIQKMSNIKNEGDVYNPDDIEKINAKRLVFIVDECHRSTFGDMLTTIKETFDNGMFFGFTGTPIKLENQKKMSTTSSLFGNELHHYSIADGIRDKNVLGFDPYQILTYKDKDLRCAVALEQAKAATEEEALADPQKKKVFNSFMTDVKMAGYKNDEGKYIKGIEDYLPKSQYERIEHKEQVVADIIENWTTLSQASKFHAIFATSSIPDAIEYYRLLKEKQPALKVTALFDPNIDNNEGVQYKEDGLEELMTDYNERYEQNFTFATHAKFKKDISARLAHKAPYKRIATESQKQLDLLIVVDQMLTGFDSKWLNTLYIDKVPKYENIIQAFSRTNRLFGPDKPFGTIRYYKSPHTMAENIKKAFKLYSGDKELDLFVDHLDHNLTKMNEIFDDIKDLFATAKIEGFTKLPEQTDERGKFAKLFKQFNNYLEAANIQGFTWDKQCYEVEEPETHTIKTIDLHIDETTFLELALRYKEFARDSTKPNDSSDIPFEIDGYLTQIDTDRIDTDYMNTRFDKYLKALQIENISKDELQQLLNNLHKSFASFTQEEQKYANIFLHDVESGDAKIQEGKPFREYITDYRHNAKNKQIQQISQTFGIYENKLRDFMDSYVSETNLNDYGRFDELKSTVKKEKAKTYFESKEHTKIPLFKVNMRVDELLKKFILSGGYDLDEE